MSRRSPWRSGSGRRSSPGSPPRPSLPTASCACRSSSACGRWDSPAMMRIPFSYIWRSLWARRLTTALTVGGVALVVFVFAGVLMLARGLEAALVETGSPDNVIVLRRSATSELSSQVDRATADVLETESGVARGGGGRALLSRGGGPGLDPFKKKSKAPREGAEEPESTRL